MKIVVLDGHTLNPGDLSWDALQALGTCVIHERTAPAEVVQRARGADILLTNKTVLDAATLRQVPGLRYIGVLATGYNVVDTAVARQLNIPVSNVPAYSTRSVAQLVFALLLELTLQVGHHAQSVARGDWARSPDFSYWHHPLTELEGRTMGIVGYGRIGQAVADLARAFGMAVLVHNRTPPRDLPAGVDATDLETLLRKSHVISLHCPLTNQTRHLMNAERLGWLRADALLINTSRGPLIDEPALRQVLDEGRIAGAGLDVPSVEPPSADHPLIGARNCLITPHIAWATQAARGRLMNTAVANVRAFLEGHPQNVVNA